jgi:hypothetical protein
MAKDTVESLSGQQNIQQALVERIVELQDHYCDGLDRDVEYAATNVRRYGNLMFLFTAAAVAFLIVAMAQLAVQKDAWQAVAAGIGTIVTGGGATFALGQRKQAESRADKLRKEQRSNCNTPPVAGAPVTSGG